MILLAAGLRGASSDIPACSGTALRLSDNLIL